MHRLFITVAVVFAAGLFLAAGLVGCGPESDMPMYKQSQAARGVAVVYDPRVTVTRIGVFEDDLAYGNKRGVYLIRDEKSGAEYIGVGGVGISERGSHTTMAGKAAVTHSDER